MSTLEVRPFRRDDRHQFTDLVNTHVAAVVPGVSVSVNTVLSGLERQPDEFITDPWVAERVTLVAEQRRYVVAAAHLLRYRADGEVGETYRDVGEIDWFVCHPRASFWPDSDEAADLLMSACLAQLARWNVRRRYASGELPVPVVHGLPRTWPHIRAAYTRAGFRHVGDTEVILLARVADLPQDELPPGVSVERTLGESGTRLTAYADGRASASSRSTRHSPARNATPERRGSPTSATCTSPPPSTARAWNAGSSPGRPTGSGCAASTVSSPTSGRATARCSTAWRARASPS